MKTKIKLKIGLQVLFVLFVLSFTGCKEDEDPDPRQAFVESFEMDDFEIHVTSTAGADSTFNISNNSEIEFEMDDDLDPDELKVELEEFLEDVIFESLKAFGASNLTVYVNVDEDIIVKISTDTFDMDDQDFNLTLSSGGSTETLPCTVEGEGELDGDIITFEFEIILSAPTVSITFEGEIEGERD